MIAPSSPADRWRQLSDAELAAEPEARLGGPLALIFASALALVACLVVTVVWIALADRFTMLMLLRSMLSGDSPASVMTRIALVPQLMLFLWSCAFTIMTLRRSPATPTTASVLIVLWAAFAAGATVGSRLMMEGYQLDVLGLVHLLPYLLTNIMIVAAFWGYMHEGRRPNLYFKRRVRV
jgi:hypothetical protein